jgi:hypothetical protein
MSFKTEEAEILDEILMIAADRNYSDISQHTNTVMDAIGILEQQAEKDERIDELERHKKHYDALFSRSIVVPTGEYAEKCAQLRQLAEALLGYDDVLTYKIGSGEYIDKIASTLKLAKEIMEHD